jgi:hypothetical protein
MRIHKHPGMSSIEREPLPRNALSDVRLGLPPPTRLCHREQGCRHLFTTDRPFRCARKPGPRSRAPLPTGVALLWTSVSLADFCNLLRRTGTPNEPPIFAREWDFRPAARRHQPMPVALAASMRCRTAGLRTANCSCRHYARHVPLARTRQSAGRSAWREGLPCGSREMPQGPSS